MNFVKCSVFSLLAFFGSWSEAEAQIRIVPEAMVGLDQITLAVTDLELAKSRWLAFGFTIQPGNDLSNNLIKFEDGTSIKLTTALENVAAPTNESQGFAEGPVTFTFQTSDTEKLREVLQSEGLEFTDAEGVFELESRHFDFFSFVKNSSANSKYLTHANGSTGLVRVWISSDRSSELAQLLVALGGEKTSRTTYVPGRASAEVVAVTNGEMVLLAKSRQLTRNRPITGATIQVRDIDALGSRLSRSKIAFEKDGVDNPRIIVAPEETGGMWLEFRE